MRHDLPVLVLGGPCSNLQALEAVLAEAQQRGIGPDRIICTGDLAAYCGQPAETIELARRSGINIVMGNCDEQLALGAADCACGFVAGSSCETLAQAWYAHADSEVSNDQRRWLAGLPRRIDLEMAGRRVAVIHGSVSRINAFVFASMPGALKQTELALSGVDGVIGGHCGLPFTQVVAGRLWHNPGIVGIPANDGTPRVWYSVLTPLDDGIEVEHAALTYDHAAAAAAMDRAGLPPEYRIALSSGLWPSCDVLPYREIRERGVAITPGCVRWTQRPQHRTGRRKSAEVDHLWPSLERDGVRRLVPGKFVDRDITASGEKRASVQLDRLQTLWFNTGTLCNITCRNCYIESSPRNDRLAYIGVGDVQPYLDEIARDGLGTSQIGFTGGEPFMNPSMLGILEICLSRDLDVLVLTNAMRPMMRLKRPLLELRKSFGKRLSLRVSLDHYTQARHEEERGSGTFDVALEGLSWLSRSGFAISVAGRTMWGEADAAARAGYRRLFEHYGIAVDAFDPATMILFPEMDTQVDVPEITTQCWSTLKKSPSDVMCASQRMVVKRSGEDRAVVMPCTLIAYDRSFEMGSTLAEASAEVSLNHPNCARFCVLGGASCAPAARDAA